MAFLVLKYSCCVRWGKVMSSNGQLFLWVLLSLYTFHLFIGSYWENPVFLFSDNPCGNIFIFQMTLWSANILAITYSLIKMFLDFRIYLFPFSSEFLIFNYRHLVNHSFVNNKCIQVIPDKYNSNFWIYHDLNSNSTYKIINKTMFLKQSQSSTKNSKII